MDDFDNKIPDDAPVNEFGARVWHDDSPTADMPRAARKQLLEEARERRRALVQAELSRTDAWAARAIEEGRAMRPAHVAHRKKLRALFAKIDASNDPDAVKIPDPPE